MAEQWQDQFGLTPMTPVSQLIGDIFVRRYYHTYHFSPGLMHRFYRETSKLGRPEANGAMASVTTKKQISDMIMSTEVVKAEIETVDAQELLSGGVIVLVTGHLITSYQDGALRDEFTQTFFLAPQVNGFYVLNDLFRFTGASAVPVAERPEELANGTAVELEQEYMEALEEYFKKADLNNNGKITRFEAVSFLRGFCVPDHVLAQILVYVDSNKHGFLRRAEFFNALRLVSFVQSNRTLTPDIVKSVLHTLATTQIPPPKSKSPGPTSSLSVASQPCSSSPRYPESDPTKASSKENNTRFNQALSLMLQDEVNLKKIAIHMEGSERSNEDKIIILRACEKILKSMNAVHSEYYRREQQHKEEIEEIQQMREDDKAYHLKIEFEVCKLELNRQKQELERNISDFKESNLRMKQHLDDMKNDVEELLNQKERSIDLCMSLSSQFSSSELEQATENFSESMKIGECGFGRIYKGTLRRTTVAIKKLNSESLQGLSQFQQEVAILSKVRHPNLVNLIGSCSDITALVYKFLPNGSLEDRLVCANNTPLTWQVRTHIINDISLALVFLHSSKPRTIIHTDLKPGNVLLDANYGSKLGGFGTSRIIEQSDTDPNAFYRTCHPADSIAYTDPHFLRTGESTPKCDVYSFGIIVLRLLTGKSPLNIASVVQEAFQSGNIRTIIDESAGKWPFRLTRKLAKLGLRCAEMSRGKRPDMVEVCAKIEPLVKIASQSIALSSDEEEHVPSHFICPILKDIMKDPCVAADGFTYETKAIKRWLSTGHKTSLMTNLLLPHHDLIPNRTLCSAIHEWLDTHTVSSVRRS